MLRWTASGWLLRDLGSHNGTLHNGNHVPPNSAVAICVGDELTFGELDEVWVVDDLEAPGLVLHPLTPGGTVIRVRADDGLYAIPSPEQPDEVLILSAGDQWRLESASGEQTALHAGSEVELQGQRFRCVVPKPVDETAEPSRPINAFVLSAAQFGIRVAPDEETAELTVRAGHIERRTGPSVPLYCLAYLARERVRTTAEAARSSAAQPVAEARVGWVATESACRDLRISREQLGVHVYRVRDSLKTLGLGNAGDVIERRRGWLRIGVRAQKISVE